MDTPASSAELFKDILSKQQEGGSPAGDQNAAETDTDMTSAEGQAPDELAMLKNRARLMGITFSNNIGLEALKAKIQEKLDADAAKNAQKEAEAKAVIEAQTASLAMPQIQAADIQVGSITATAQASMPAPKPAKQLSLRQRILQEEMRLIRVRITNLNPAKKDLPGEILTVANEYLGTVRKFIPFGEVTENGYHVPYCLYKQLKRRQFVQVVVKKDSKGRDYVEHRNAREFALEVLDPLTPEELAKLAAAQAATRGVE